MVIDTHMHLIRPFDSKGNPQVYCPGKAASAEDYVALMDQSGIDRAFFISWSPEDIPSDLLVKGIAVESVRETMNREYALEVMRRFPDRFYWFPCHINPSVANYLNIAHENLELGAAGLKLVPSFWGELPDDARLIPIYGLAQDYEANIIIDTSYWYLGKDYPADPESLPPGHRDVAKRVKDFEDYTKHLDPIFTSYPDINFQLAHAGARKFTPENAYNMGKFMSEYPNVFADLGALSLDSQEHITPRALERLVEAAGADRVMFGTDWPHFAQGSVMSEVIGHIRRPGRFPQEVSEMILGGNALRFLKGRSPGLR